MSKPSITNCPNTFFRKVHSFSCWLSIESRGTVVLYYQIQFACVQIRHNPLSGGYCGEVPPLPIPNREVKLTCADGTAMQCGRVGSRLLSSEASITKVVGAFLFSCGFCFLTLIAFLCWLLFYADCFFVTQIWLSLRPPIFNSQMTQILLAVFSFYSFILLLFYPFTLLSFYSFTFLLFYPFTYSSFLNDNCCYLISVLG